MALRALFQDKNNVDDKVAAVPHPYSEVLLSTALDSATRPQPDEYIYLPLDGISFYDLYDWVEYPPGNPTNPTPPGRTPPKRDARACGSLVKINEESISLFRYGAEVYATAMKCPHAGGPLHMGDIENLPGRNLCVRCPWHGWRFNLMNGKCVGKDGVFVQTFPVRVDLETGKMAVGFLSLNPSYFGDSTF